MLRPRRSRPAACRAHRAGPLASPRCRRHAGRRARCRAVQSRLAPSRNSRLPSRPRIGEAMRPRTLQPSAATVSATFSPTAAWIWASRDDALLDAGAAGLELRLDQGDEPRGGPRQPQRRRQNELERDEAHVDDHKGGRRHEPARLECTDIGALDDHDLGAGAQLAMQLVPPDVDRGKCARRRAPAEHR